MWSLMSSLGRLTFVCRTHFFKVLVLVLVSLMALQYGLSMAFYGGKPYFLGNYQLFSNGRASNATSLNGTRIFGGTASSDGGVKLPNATSGSTRGSTEHSTTTEDREVSSAPYTLAVNTTLTILTANLSMNAPISTTMTAKELPPCPAVPPKLVGPVKVLTDAPSLVELEKLHPELELGGRFRPKDCKSKHKVAIIIPYRDREEHLRLFLHNIHPILERQQLDYGIFIVEEAGTTKFNRAMLMNIGFVEALKLYDWQCFIFHDVDLLPEDDRNIYSCPEQPRHMSVAVDTMGYKLPYADIFGGVSALTKEQMEKVNGFSNEFWGWGGEDDDMANRIKYYGYRISRYSATLARYKMMKHTKDKPNPDRYNKLYKGKTRYKTDGINSLKYKRKDLLLKRLYTWVYVEMEKPK